MVTTSVLFRLLVKRTGAVVLRRCGVILQTSAVVVLFTATVLAEGHRPPLAVAWVAPATPLTGLLGRQTVLTMATCMVVPFLLAAAAAVIFRRHAVEPADSDRPLVKAGAQ